MDTKLQSLQKLADSITRLKVVEVNFDDKRKKPKYYVTHEDRWKRTYTKSPVLSYDHLYGFILGFHEGYEEAY